jgi:hypothetical protein
MFEAIWKLDTKERYNYDTLVSRGFIGVITARLSCLTLCWSYHFPIMPLSSCRVSASQVAKDKPTSRPASWHPGPHGHELRGRILAYHYLRLLEDSLSDAYFALANGEVRWPHGYLIYNSSQCFCLCTTPVSLLSLPLFEQVSSLLEPEVRKLPPPLACDAALCGHPTSCALTYEPRAESYLLDYVTKPDQVRVT